MYRTAQLKTGAVVFRKLPTSLKKSGGTVADLAKLLGSSRSKNKENQREAVGAS
ncbi:hypothetical protein [Pseudobythopirellula maris]|uniref:hypothetical protein n=1 Tax=Pseudobythopirellula maris TaxID=2527991 RepID=UPI0018D2D751|nr:hypothetical protein [Pseudobythopirellula maris]